MKPSVLFVITSDPRVSPRLAEAVRIAAGVSAMKKVDLLVYFGGPALLALGESADLLVDGESFSQYLPLIPCPIHVEAGSPFLEKLGAPAMELNAITTNKLAKLSADQTYLIRFDGSCHSSCGNADSARDYARPTSRSLAKLSTETPFAKRSDQTHLLHILTKPEDHLAQEVIGQQKNHFEIEVVDLTKTSPDYDHLLESIFTADSVQVW